MNSKLERVVQIESVGDHRYRIAIQGVEKDLDSTELMNMLGAETLVNGSNEAVSLQEALNLLDREGAGCSLAFSLRRNVA